MLALRTQRWLYSVAMAASFSIAIEVLQAVERTSNIDDVVLNTTGAAFGATLGLVARRVLGSTDSDEGRRR